MRAVLDPVGDFAVRHRVGMLLAVLVLVCLPLAGCGPRLPERVLVPVEVPCKVDVPARPVWATKALPADADIFDQVRALLAERKQRIAYERLLEAAVASCNATSTTPAVARLSR